MRSASCLRCHAATMGWGGDDEEAKARVRALLHMLTFRDEWILNLGGLETARATEALVLLVPHVLERSGFAPFAIGVAR